MKDKISKMQVFKENGWSFQTMEGSIDKDAEQLLPNASYKPEPPKDPDKVEGKSGQAYMLPPRQSDHLNGQDTTALTKSRPVAGDEEPLYPLGVNPNDNS